VEEKARKRLLKALTPIKKDLERYKTKTQYLIQHFSLENNWESGPLDHLAHTYTFLVRFSDFISKTIQKTEGSEDLQITDTDVKLFELMGLTLEIDITILRTKYNISLLEH